MKEQTKPSGDLLVLTTDREMSAEESAKCQSMANILGEKLGMKALFLSSGIQAKVERDLTPLIEMMGKQVEAINRLAGAIEEMLSEEDQVQDETAGDYYLNKPRKPS